MMCGILDWGRRELAGHLGLDVDFGTIPRVMNDSACFFRPSPRQPLLYDSPWFGSPTKGEPSLEEDGGMVQMIRLCGCGDLLLFERSCQAHIFLWGVTEEV